MKCLKCGTENLDNAKFCFKCGASLEEETVKEETVSESSVPEKVEETISEQNSSEIKEKVEETKPVEEITPSPATTVLPKNVDTTPKKPNKKVLYIVLAVVLVAIVAVAVIFLTKGKDDEKAEQVFNTDSLILIEENDKYGYINTEGKVVIKPQYDYATQFYGNFAEVAIKVEQNGTKETVYEVIDTKGNVKATAKFSSQIEYVEEENTWIINGQLFDSNLKALSKAGIVVDYEDYGYYTWNNYQNKTAGIMNKSGKVTYTYQFTGSEDYLGLDPSDISDGIKDRYCRINIENEKYAIVNCETGKVVYDFTTDYIYEKDNNIFEISNKKTYEFIKNLYIQNDKVVYSTTDKSDRLYYYSSGKYIQISNYSKEYDDRYSYINVLTGEITKEMPKNSDSSKEDLDEWEEYSKMQKFSCSSGYGIMSGETIKIPCEWTDIDYLDLELYKYLSARGKDYVVAEKDRKTYLLNLKTGKTDAEFNTTYIYDDDDTTFIYYTDDTTKKKVYYNLVTNKSIAFESDVSVRIYSNYIVASENGKKNYYNTEFKLIYTEK